MKKTITEYLKEVRNILETYKNTNLWNGLERPCIKWLDGYTLGMGWASHASGDPGGFHRICFKGYDEFYSIPMEKRNEFLEKGLKLFDETFKKNIRRNTKKYDEFYKKLTPLAEECRKYAGQVKIKRNPHMGKVAGRDPFDML